MPNNLPTDFDDEPVENATSTKKEVPVKDENGIPYCEKHHCRMKQTSGGRKGSSVAYFACPVDGCEEKAKRIKTPQSIVPAEPHLCPKCHNEKPRPVMEREPRLSNMMYTILMCGCCGHKTSPMPRPEFVANHQMSRQAVSYEELGAR